MSVPSPPRLSLVLGQVQEYSLSNDIIEILVYLELLDCKGRVMSSDVTHTTDDLGDGHKNGDDYVVILNGSHVRYSLILHQL
ncbi:MAG: hypothetical protein OXC02_01975 [Rhodobacteraceae bacterium]|nr:hypothetical protein [Paracoccaceae bacterium]